MTLRAAAVPLLALLVASCSTTTAKLSDAMRTRLESEGIVRRDDDETFRVTTGTTRRHWEEGRASLVLTHHTVLIHKNDRVLLEISPSNAARWRVRRDHDRVSIASEGAGARSWSFHPKDGDAEGWARDLRAAMQAAAG